VLRSRVEMPRNAGLLAKAGVRFALASGNDYTDFGANLRRAVDAGLTREQALRALTIDPATIFGVADRLGSIEAGKVANLTIVRGDIFDEGARVTELFIDGQHFKIAAPRNGTGPGRES
ncbi:MAG TPA: amidohydrolase family protein, partial [Gemmatimonadales bacterium]|nr:amidohydrolase family protein [Gemmatimonadales bacterium]